jgi:hypothetical protein
VLEHEFDRCEIFRQFGFCKNGVNFAVTDFVNDGDRPVFAALKFWNQVMFAFFRRWNGATTQRAEFPAGFRINF